DWINRVMVTSALVVVLFYLFPSASLFSLPGSLQAMGSSDGARRMVGWAGLVPPLVALLSLGTLARSDRRTLGVLFAAVLVGWLAVLVGAHGIFVLLDPTRVYVAIALFFATVSAILSWAQLGALSLKQL